MLRQIKSKQAYLIFTRAHVRTYFWMMDEAAVKDTFKLQQLGLVGFNDLRDRSTYSIRHICMC